ncbi:hypothetical protein [Arthrobacter sp. YD2]|uniref:hypothetical protein n=1 Tax=Arthrobacter sp. YD2 TaxID=3058046 RepID=UPI0025B52675|nr:hypothetical protein [Arthrobacter sp. YD2]MDN3903485.1 hypothetical protein [Arthrobacter sp. YD2]
MSLTPPDRPGGGARRAAVLIGEPLGASGLIDALEGRKSAFSSLKTRKIPENQGFLQELGVQAGKFSNSGGFASAFPHE